MSVAELAQLCVEQFPTSTTRQRIIDGLVAVVGHLSRARVHGEIWINGSFVTEKLNPADVDILLHVSSTEYDRDSAKRAVIDWASDENRLRTHSCDAYKWVEYDVGHPLHLASEDDRMYWSDWYGKDRTSQPKGIAIIELPVAIV